MKSHSSKLIRNNHQTHYNPRISHDWPAKASAAINLARDKHRIALKAARKSGRTAFRHRISRLFGF